MKSIKLIIGAGILACVSSVLSVHAESDKSEINPQMTNLLKSRLGNMEVGKPVTTPVDGIYQTQFGSKFAYLTGDGRYVLIGDMIDLQSQTNLTEIARQGIAKKALATMPAAELAVFPAMSETKAVLNVFTDTSCPYCKKLHEEVPELQKAGIEVRYFPFPRGGKRGPGYQDLKQVWCSDDRAKAMDIAKEISKGELSDGSCAKANLVDKGYDLGNQVGVTGTPALFTASGRKFDGYVPYQKLIPMLLSGS
jgi:thiol:disulfide interchange protein DsbC